MLQENGAVSVGFKTMQLLFSLRSVLCVVLPEVGAVEGGDHISAGLSTGGQRARLPGLLLGVHRGAGEDVQLLGVVELSSHSHPSVLQALQLMKSKTQGGNRLHVNFIQVYSKN